MTPTPRTDALQEDWEVFQSFKGHDAPESWAEHSRKLETELAAVTAERDALKAEVDNALKILWSRGLLPSAHETLNKSVDGICFIVDHLRNELENPPSDVQQHVITMLDLVHRDAITVVKSERDSLSVALESLLSVAEAMDGIETLNEACREAREALKGEVVSNPWRECAEEAIKRLKIEREAVARFLVPWKSQIGKSWLDHFIESGIVVFDSCGFVYAAPVDSIAKLCPVQNAKFYQLKEGK